MATPYGQGPGAVERDTTLRDLVAVIFKRKWLILGVFLVTTSVITVQMLRRPVTYSANATVMLNRQQRQSVLEQYARALPWVEVIESEVEVVRSVPVLQMAQVRLARPSRHFPEGLKLGLRQLHSSVDAGMIGESNVIFITGTSRDRRAAVAIANTVAESYIAYHRELFKLPDASGFIREQADSTFTVLKSLEAQRERLLEGIGLTDLKEEEQSLIRYRTQRRGELGKARLDLARLETELKDARHYLLADDPSIPYQANTGSVQGNSLIEALLKVRRKRAEVADLRSRYTDQYPALREAQSALERNIRELRASLKQLVTVKEHEVRVARERVATLEAEIANLDTELATLPRLRAQRGILDTQIEGARKQFSSLTQQVSSSAIKAVSFEDYGVKLLSPAVTANRNKKGDMVRVALGPLLALLAGIGLAFYLENLDHSLKNREDVEQHLEIPVLASFPDVQEAEASLEEHNRRIPFARRGS